MPLEVRHYLEVKKWSDSSSRVVVAATTRGEVITVIPSNLLPFLKNRISDWLLSSSKYNFATLRLFLDFSFLISFIPVVYPLVVSNYIIGQYSAPVQVFPPLFKFFRPCSSFSAPVRHAIDQGLTRG